jgi:hypothetical protein
MTIIGPNYRPVSTGACHRAPPSPLGHRKRIPYGQSSAHISTSRYEICVQRGKYAVQYRDFVFRRIFAKNQENGVQDILLNVRELCRLDTSYVSG